MSNDQQPKKKEKPYKCAYCGRRFNRPTAHKCKDGFRKRRLSFEYTPTEEDFQRLEESAKSFFEELDNVVEELDNIAPASEEVAKDLLASITKNAILGEILPKKDAFGKLPTICEEESKKERACEPLQDSPLDTQVGGDHYRKYKIQPIEFAMANNLNPCQFSIMKYVLRYKDKNGLEDLKKARHFLDILIQTEYPESHAD